MYPFRQSINATDGGWLYQFVCCLLTLNAGRCPVHSSAGAIEMQPPKQPAKGFQKINGQWVHVDDRNNSYVPLFETDAWQIGVLVVLVILVAGIKSLLGI